MTFLHVLATLWPKTKHSIPIIYSVLISIFFVFMFSSAQAQSPQNREAANGQAEVKPLQIGDTIPEELWHLPLQVVNHPEGKHTITLNDYRDRKLIILDFWATWCGSCIAAMSDLDHIEKKYKAALAIIPVTYEERDHVIAFSKSNPILKKLYKKSVVVDSILKEAFPHRLIPHYIWIDNTGSVIHVTASNSLTEENIASVLNNESIDLEVKQDHMHWNEKTPILLDNPSSSAFYRSILMGADQGYPSRRNIIYNKKENKLRIYVLNRSIHSLYEIAYRFPAVYHSSRIEADMTNISDIDEQLYCYEGEIAGNDTAKLFLHMQRDLDLQLDITSSIIGEERWCWILKNQRGTKTLNASHMEPFHNLDDENRKNIILKGQYIYLLASILSKSYTDLPFRNETGIRYTIDIDLPMDLGNIKELNTKLNEYGLVLTKEKRKIDVLYLIGHHTTE